jgi:shikimate kinase
MKIVFIGYMASGKSAIAKEISAKLNLKLIDLDAYIEENQGAEISEIFKKKGEVYFRKKEQVCLNEVLSQDDSFVLSVGGGAPCFSGNMDLIVEKGISFYLKASMLTIYNRLILEKAKRPLVAHIADEDLQEFIAKHLFERAAFYEQSNHTISVNDKTILQITDEILKILT